MFFQSEPLASKHDTKLVCIEDEMKVKPVKRFNEDKGLPGLVRSDSFFSEVDQAETGMIMFNRWRKMRKSQKENREVAAI